MKYSTGELVITEEIELANLLDDDGTPLITHWYEPNQDFYSADKLAVRNRADLDFWERKDFGITAEVSVHDFTKINNSNAVKTRRNSIDMDFDLSEYTVFIVANVASEMTAITGFIGTVDTASVVNTPAIQYSVYQNEIRVLGGHTNNDIQITHPMTPDEAQKIHLITLTRSTDNGASLRLDGRQVGQSTSATARAAVTAKRVRLLGYSAQSGALNGTAGNIIICKKDLSRDSFSLRKIESYLISKYAITP